MKLETKINREEQYSLVLLAGGKSSRMGSDKAKLLYRGKTFTKMLLEKAKELGIVKIYVSGYEEEGIPTIWDVYKEIGPLGGLHACMSQITTPYCLVVPVDVPQIPKEILNSLLEYHSEIKAEEGEKAQPVLLKHGGRRENLIGIYPVQMAAFIEECIQSNRLSVHGMLDTWGNICFEAEIPDWQIANINTKENYEELLKMSKEEK